MPTRLLREGILTSERVDQLDAQAEVFYRRLMSKVDDHGLYDARPSILRTSLYPLRVDRVREADISRHLAACQKAGLIVLYEAESKPYLWMRDTGWEERSKPKCPLPPESARKQAQASVPLFVVGVVDVGVDEKPRKRGPHALPDDFQITEEIREWCANGGYDQPQASLDYMRDWAKSGDKRKSDWVATLRNCIKGDWGGARKMARERIMSNPNAPRQITPCTTPGCKGEGAPIWKGKCAVCHAQSKPARAA